MYLKILIKKNQSFTLRWGTEISLVLFPFSYNREKSAINRTYKTIEKKSHLNRSIDVISCRSFKKYTNSESSQNFRSMTV